MISVSWYLLNNNQLEALCIRKTVQTICVSLRFVRTRIVKQLPCQISPDEARHGDPHQESGIKRAFFESYENGQKNVNRREMLSDCAWRKNQWPICVWFEICCRMNEIRNSYGVEIIPLELTVLSERRQEILFRNMIIRVWLSLPEYFLPFSNGHSCGNDMIRLLSVGTRFASIT